jgi:hypothetical protein
MLLPPILSPENWKVGDRVIRIPHVYENRHYEGIGETETIELVEVVSRDSFFVRNLITGNYYHITIVNDIWFRYEDLDYLINSLLVHPSPQPILDRIADALSLIHI